MSEGRCVIEWVATAKTCRGYVQISLHSFWFGRKFGRYV
jgi:hypothetical protein